MKFFMCATLVATLLVNQIEGHIGKHVVKHLLEPCAKGIVGSAAGKTYTHVKEHYGDLDPDVGVVMAHVVHPCLKGVVSQAAGNGFVHVAKKVYHRYQRGDFESEAEMDEFIAEAITQALMDEMK